MNGYSPKKMLLENFKIVSWNVNGIRSAKTPMKQLLDSFDADVICLQETKASRCQLSEDIANVNGYSSYFTFSRIRNGYSGVVTFCRDQACPVAAEEGLSGLLVRQGTEDAVGHYGSSETIGKDALQSLDGEGRAVITKHRIRLKGEDRDSDLVIINLYCPRAEPGNLERHDFKMRFYELLQRRALSVFAAGCHVIIVGDINTSHRPIDHCDPTECEDFENRPERKWLDEFLLARDAVDAPPATAVAKFVDTFRYFYPEATGAFTCWCTKLGARQTNYGTRLDYVFADVDLCRKGALLDSRILPEIDGSDHCPIVGILAAVPLPSCRPPSICSRFWPEFAGKQRTLTSFLNGTTVEVSSAGVSKRNQLLETDTLRSAKRSKVANNQTSIANFFSKSKPPEPAVVMTTDDPVESSNFKRETVPLATAWKTLFKGQAPAPKCKRHGEECVRRTVKKPGPNFRREFYACARPTGRADDPEASCNFFQWVRK